MVKICYFHHRKWHPCLQMTWTPLFGWDLWWSCDLLSPGFSCTCGADLQWGACTSRTHQLPLLTVGGAGRVVSTWLHSCKAACLWNCFAWHPFPRKNRHIWTEPLLGLAGLTPATKEFRREGASLTPKCLQMVEEIHWIRPSEISWPYDSCIGAMSQSSLECNLNISCVNERAFDHFRVVPCNLVSPWFATRFMDNLARVLGLRWDSGYRASVVAQWWGIHLQCRRCGFSPWVGKISWRRAWQPTLVFLPGESHGQRSLVGYNP